MISKNYCLAKKYFTEEEEEVEVKNILMPSGTFVFVLMFSSIDAKGSSGLNNQQVM